jgi:hypothetical protein
MSYTLWRHGVLLGRTDLAMARPVGSDFRTGQLETSPEFGHAWSEFGPAFDELIAAGLALGDVTAGLPSAADGVDPAERPRQVYELLSTHPGAARLRAANEAVSSLGLELRDEMGSTVPSDSVMVHEVRLPEWVTSDLIAREVEEARKEGAEILLPRYIVVVHVRPSL